MKCPSCGRENTGDSRFCAFCGGKLTAENNANNAVQGFEHNYEKKPKKSKLPVIIAVIIAAVILLVAGFFVLKFTVLDAFAQETRVKGGLTDFFTVNDDIAELEKSFKKNSGYIKPSEINIVLDEVGDYAKEKLEAGEIKDYAVTENESVWIQFTSGVEYIYVPQTEESEKTNDETKNEDSSQQGGSDESENNSSQEAQSHQAALRIFDKQSEEISEEKLKEISEQYKLELTDSEELTLEMIEEIGKDKLVVWYGDGGYSEKTSALLPTSVRLDEERLQNDPEYLKELGYYEEYLSGGIVCTNGGYIAVTSKFFESRTETFDGCVFYLGSASSGKDDVLAKALLDKKASAVLANTEAICNSYNLDMINSVLSGMWRANSERKYNSLSEALAKAKEKNGDFCCDDHPDTEVTIFGNGAESFRLSETEAREVASSFVNNKYYVESNGIVYYVDQNGLWKNTGKLKSELLFGCKATNIATNGEVIYYSVYNKDSSEYCEDFKQNMTWHQFDMYSYDLRTSVNKKITSFVECGKPVCEFNGKVYYTDYPQDYTGNCVGLAQSLFSVDLKTGEKKFICNGANIVYTYGNSIFFRDIVVSLDTSNAKIKCYDMVNDTVNQITDDGVSEFNIKGDSLFYIKYGTQFPNEKDSVSHTKTISQVYKYNILSGGNEKIFEETSESVWIQYVDDKYLYYALSTDSYHYSNYRIELSNGSKTHIKYKSENPTAPKMSDEYPYRVIKTESAALYFDTNSTCLYQAKDNDSYAVPYYEHSNVYDLLTVNKNCVYGVKKSTDFYFYEISIYNLNLVEDKLKEEITGEEAAQIVYEKYGGDGYQAVYWKTVDYNGKEYYLINFKWKVDDGNGRYHYSHIEYYIVSLDGSEVKAVDYDYNNNKVIPY